MRIRRIRLTKRTGLLASAALSATALLISISAPANAAPPPRVLTASDGTITVFSTTAPQTLSPTQQAELRDLEASSSAIQRATSGASFDYAASVRYGARISAAAKWAQGVSLGGGRVLNAPVGLNSPVSPLPLLNALAACRGQNAIWTDYLGSHARFSSCVVPKVVSALQAGVGATALAATIATAASLGIAAVSAIVPALIQYSAWSIDACGKNGTGVELVFAGFICWAQ